MKTGLTMRAKTDQQNTPHNGPGKTTKSPLQHRTHRHQPFVRFLAYYIKHIPFDNEADHQKNQEMAAKYIKLMATLTPKIPRPRSEMYDTS